VWVLGAQVPRPFGESPSCYHGGRFCISIRHLWRTPMADSASQVAVTMLEHSARIRLLSGIVDKQRRAYVRLAGIVGILLAVQAYTWMSARFGDRAVLQAQSLILENKEGESVALEPGRNGLQLLLSGNGVPSGTGLLLKSEPAQLSLVGNGHVLWKTP
jgi:hypothetical protein